MNPRGLLGKGYRDTFITLSLIIFMSLAAYFGMFGVGIFVVLFGFIIVLGIKNPSGGQP